MIPELRGRYLFGDYCTGRIWSFKYENKNIVDFEDLTELININDGNKTVYISSFGQDLNGELYIIDYGGKIYKLINK